MPFFPEPTFGMLPPGPGYWALTRFDDVVEASRTPKVFTSGAGATNITDLPPEFLEFFGSMINLDDPRHSRLRRIVSRGFTPKRLAALTEEVQRTASRIVDDALAQGECDAVTAISARLPLKIVCDMMGVPESQYELRVRQDQHHPRRERPGVRAGDGRRPHGRAAGGPRAGRADARAG